MINAEHINTNVNYYDPNKSTTIEIGDMSRFDGEQYDLQDDRDFVKFVSDVERLARNSFEYRRLTWYCKNYLGMHECAVMRNVSSADGGVRVEIHHSPLTLYDISITVIRKRLHNNESMNIYDVCNEVLYAHYLKYVGLISLCQTVHEMVHNQFYFIPTDKQFGHYRPFVEAYYNYIDPEVLDAIDAAERATADNTFKNQNEIFNNHPIYVQPRNHDPKSILNYKNTLYDRIDEIKNNYNNPQPELKTMCYIVDNSVPRH